MKQFLSSLFFLFTFTLSYGQKHDNIWLFGYNVQEPQPENYGGCVLDFNLDPAATYKEEREMNLNVTVASICDSTGNLLFYTNGIYIANHTHGMMENGDSLNPGEITTNSFYSGLKVFQSEIVLPFPGHEGMYYLLHLKLDYDDVFILAVNTFYYSLIDMYANNGLGKVVLKNQEMLTEQTLGTISAVKHANGRDWWVVVSDFYAYTYRLFLLSPDGLNFSSEQSFGQVPAGLNGTISFSPDGTKMAGYEVPLDNVVFYDFDRCTGVISNPITVNLPEVELGAGQAFSSDSRFFYMASSTFILQADTWAPDIASTIDTVAVYDGYADPLSTTFFAMQPGPDGRIYITTNNGSQVLHYINQPNKAGDSCQVVQHGLQLPTRNRFTSPHFPNYRLGPLDGSPCDTLGLDNHPVAGFRYEANSSGNTMLVAFIDNSFYEPTDWYWDFGHPNGVSGNSSTEVNPWHTFPGPGTYTVCLTVSNQYDSSTVCHDVELVVSGTDEVVRDAGYLLYPNPTQGMVNLKMPVVLEGKGELQLFNLYGQHVSSFAILKKEKLLSFGTDNLQPGIYLVRLLENGEETYSTKLIVIK
jgi:PKD repeat protein